MRWLSQHLSINFWQVFDREPMYVKRRQRTAAFLGCDSMGEGLGRESKLHFRNYSDAKLAKRAGSTRISLGRNEQAEGRRQQIGVDSVKLRFSNTISLSNQNISLSRFIVLSVLFSNPNVMNGKSPTIESRLKRRCHSCVTIDLNLNNWIIPVRSFLYKLDRLPFKLPLISYESKPEKNL